MMIVRDFKCSRLVPEDVGQLDSELEKPPFVDLRIQGCPGEAGQYGRSDNRDDFHGEIEDGVWQ